MRRKFSAGFAVLYGICETVNGNWSQLDMTSELGASKAQASLALTAFWATVTGGRVLFAAIQRWVPSRLAYHLLPFVLVAAFALIAALSGDKPAFGILAFALAGLGCSALLPLPISFGQEELSSIAAAFAGGVIAFYQLGYGIAAFGTGPLIDGGVSLTTIYAFSAVIPGCMGVWLSGRSRSRAVGQGQHPCTRAPRSERSPAGTMETAFALSDLLGRPRRLRTIYSRGRS